MPDLPGKSWKVSCSQDMLSRVRAFQSRAAELNIQPDFQRVMNTLIQQLLTDPLGWGDPQYRFHQLDLLQCHGICEFMQVYYAVDEERQIVFITELRPMPNHPLEESS